MPISRSSGMKLLASVRGFHSSVVRLAPAPSVLEVRLRDGLKSAMKARDKASATCIKAVLADITNVAKAGPNPNDPASESAVINALRKGIDKRREAADAYAPSSPSASAEQHASLTNEIKLLAGYLPSAPSAESLRTTISEVIAGLSVAERQAKGAMGTAMKAVLEALGSAAGAVDRKEVSRMVQEGLRR